MPPVVEAGGPRALVIGHLLGEFELAAVLQVGRDPRRTEGVGPDLGPDAGGGGAAAEHAPHVGLAEAAPGQGGAADGLEQGGRRVTP